MRLLDLLAGGAIRTDDEAHRDELAPFPLLCFPQGRWRKGGEPIVAPGGHGGKCAGPPGARPPCVAHNWGTDPDLDLDRRPQPFGPPRADQGARRLPPAECLRFQRKSPPLRSPSNHSRPESQPPRPPCALCHRALQRRPANVRLGVDGRHLRLGDVAQGARQCKQGATGTGGGSSAMRQRSTFSRRVFQGVLQGLSLGFGARAVLCSGRARPPCRSSLRSLMNRGWLSIRRVC